MTSTSPSSSDRPLAVALDLRLAGYRGGGIARYAVELHDALRDISGIAPRALRSRRDPAICPDDIALRTPPHHRLERYAVGVELALARYHPAVYHATDVIAPILPTIPVIATVHDLAFVHWPADLAPDALAYYRQLQHSRQRTAAWITPSQWTADDLATIYDIDPASIHVIPHGASLGLLDGPPLNRARRGDYVLAVGTIEPRKRFDLLLDAARIVAGLPRIVIAGAPGWNSAEIEMRLRATPGVEWLPALDDLALQRLNREALAVAVSSRAEGYGLPALEAMAAGTPVLSSGGGALSEVTGDAALTVADPDPVDWAAAITRIAADTPLWQRLSDAGRVRAAEFTWQRAAKMTAGLYRAVSG